ncbi:FemAB family PEP-CTERM system-associated protein [Acidiphilium sp. PA]|uniref:FemAB family XrtA/PEP-CTERM system-associated protein n=1 Tax=Acidiphilium sp. PA TaxID=2871705 RepID=UPI002243419E|nr:FemAB family XrtA/PEP-CTERM system-associated protein [Acidiphilium sp. PA]MCW8309006.1 FemAB family PEP-CTERM system-associated protein [Acidiphilium sp. PA]
MSITCRVMTDDDRARWDDFVLAHPAGHFFHRAAWQDVIKTAFGQRPYFMLAERAGAICGLLPLVHMKSRLFHRNTLVSTPFCVYGGPIGSDDAVTEALIEAATGMMRQLGADSFELRSIDDPVQRPGWQPGPPIYDTFRRTLPPDEDACLKSIPRKQRAVVRKGIDLGLTSRIDRDWRRFFHLYAESVHNLGTPVFPARYFRLLLDCFGSDAEVLTVYDGDAPICAVLSFAYKGEISPYYAGGGTAARGKGGHDFMYWQVMRRAIALGLATFDFGRSKRDTGPHKFKTNWGFTPTPLGYQFLLEPGATLPDTNPLSPKYQRKIALWKRLPRPLVNALGPIIVRGLG